MHYAGYHDTDGSCRVFKFVKCAKAVLPGRTSTWTAAAELAAWIPCSKVDQVPQSSQEITSSLRHFAD